MNARKYQNEIANIFRNIFGEELVRVEWDSVKHDGHTMNHKIIYAPRHDIVVGPFNSYMDIDLGVDNAEPMKKHPFTKKLYKEHLKDREIMDKIWNKASRCYLVVEIEFSGTSKHIMGSIINASVSGSIGIIVTNEKNIKKTKRISKYLLRLEGLDKLKINLLRNLIIFSEDEFIDFLNNFR